MKCYVGDTCYLKFFSHESYIYSQFSNRFQIRLKNVSMAKLSYVYCTTSILTILIGVL